MKLKYTLMSLLALSAASMAHADILRFHYKDYDYETKELVDCTKDFGANNFYQIQRYQHYDYETQEPDYGFDYIHFGDEEYSCPSLADWIYTKLFSSVEILRSEKVALEIDAPKWFWIVGSSSYGDYYLEFNGKVRFVEGADSGQRYCGSVYASPHSPVSFPASFSPKGAPALQIDTRADDEDVWQWWKGESLNFEIGGDKSDEFEFVVRIPTFCAPALDVKLMDSDGNLEDMCNVGTIQIWSTAYYINMYRQNLPAKNGKLDPYDDVVSFMVTPPVAMHGGKAIITVDNVNGDTNVEDYVTFESPWEIEFDNESTIITGTGEHKASEGYSFEALRNVTYKFDKFDLTQQTNQMQVTYKVDFELAPGAPDWLQTLVDKAGQTSFTHQVSTYYVEVDDWPFKLPIDVNKVSFPDMELTEGSLEALFDDDPATFCHSSWNKANDRSQPFCSFIDIELDEPVQAIGFAMQARKMFSTPASPTKMRLYYSNDGENWSLLGDAETTPLASERWYMEHADEANWFKAPEPFKYVRWCALESNKGSLDVASTQRYWNLAELHFYGK